MSRLIATVEGCEIWSDDAGNVVKWRARARVDVDGAGSSHGDPCYQSDTSLHVDGKPLNADVDSYIVVHPSVLHAVRGVVLGCQAFVTYRGVRYDAVVGDVGPRLRLGELSYALAVRMGINPSPNTGGVDEPVVDYEITPGLPALVGRKTYKLQPSR